LLFLLASLASVMPGCAAGAGSADAPMQRAQLGPPRAPGAESRLTRASAAPVAHVFSVTAGPPAGAVHKGRPH